MSTHELGMLSLNLAFVLYLFVFLPQIWHNRNSAYLQNLSPMMHSVLYFGVLLDLFYGFANDFQWQYKTVSVVSLLVLTIQHLQLLRFFYRHGDGWALVLHSSVGLLMLAGLLHFFLGMEHMLSATSALLVGYGSRVCYQLYAIPQILKNRKSHDANAMSRYFLSINSVLLILDTVSAWCLDWGWPAKLSPPISLMMMAVLLYQRRSFSLASA